MSSPGLGIALPARPRLLDGWALALAALAAAVVGAGLLLGWRGVDLPAQLYRVDLFRHQGFALWDSQWFGGHWLLDYSVLFPAVAASVGVGAVTVGSGVLATVAFDRLVVDHFGRSARLASLAFALGVTAQTSIGQLTFLLGEAAGLWCLVLVARRRWVPAAALATGAALTSPLAGAFVALAVITRAVIVVGWPARESGPGIGAWGRLRTAAREPQVRGHLAVALAVAIPVGVVSSLFPGQGPMPYPFVDYLWEMAVAAGLFALTPRRDRTMRVGLVLYALAATASEVVPTPLGGNVGRLEDCLALPLVAALLWPRIASPVGRSARRVRSVFGRRRVLLAVVAVPLALSQWTPAWAAMTSNGTRPWTHEAYYHPLVTWLRARPGPAGRVEVVPTADHWETAYVAPVVPIARGWERQLDLADNPIFYTSGALTASSYRSWLVDNGVRYVALPDAPLDVAGVAEGRLVARGVPGLTLAWHGGGWRTYAVAGSAGIVGPGGHLVRLEGGQLVVALDRPGTVEVRVRFSPSWQVDTGSATISEAPGKWLQVTSDMAGTVVLGLHVL